MITVETLNQMLEKSNEFTSSTNDIETLFNKHDSYYKWLLSIRNDNTLPTEMEDITLEHILRLIYGVTQWMERCGIVAKEHSTGWDKKLVARVGKYCKEYTDNPKVVNSDNVTFKVKQHYIFNDLMRCDDMATVAYCWQMLQRAIGYELIPILIKMLTIKRSVAEKKVDSTKMKPSVNGEDNPIEDYGGLYWHSTEEKLMTYDECTERKLDHRMLACPIGIKGKQAYTYVGFEEPDVELREAFNEQYHKKFLEMDKNGEKAWYDDVLVADETTV